MEFFRVVLGDAVLRDAIRGPASGSHGWPPIGNFEFLRRPCRPCRVTRHFTLRRPLHPVFSTGAKMNPKIGLMAPDPAR